jgi:hypothetical protein
VRLRRTTAEPVVQASVVAVLAVAASQLGEVAGWFVIAVVAGVSLSGSL